MRIKTFEMFESRGLVSKNNQSQETINTMVKDLLLIKDIFQSFEEEWNSEKSDYIILTTDRKVLKYNGDSIEDGMGSLTQLEWKDYYDGKVNTDIWKVKISFPKMKKDRLEKMIADSLSYIDRIESEGFYFSTKYHGITSHIGMGRSTTTYYDIATKSSDYYRFIDTFDDEYDRYGNESKLSNFYLYFTKS
jgi:hypothetical protein